MNILKVLQNLSETVQSNSKESRINENVRILLLLQSSDKRPTLRITESNENSSVVSLLGLRYLYSTFNEQ